MIQRARSCFQRLLPILMTAAIGSPAWSDPSTSILPDPVVVERGCDDVEASADRYSSAQISELRAACQKYSAGAIDGEAWLAQVHAVGAPAADTSCESCRRIDELSKADPIPRRMNAYVLFLVPSVDWEAKSADLARLRLAFEAFGRAIGDHHTAIWFKADDGGPDFLRSKHYADLLDLGYNDGPFVVVSRIRPDLLGKGDERTVIQLNGIPAQEIVPILNILEKDLRTGRAIRKDRLLYEEISRRLRAGVERHWEKIEVIGDLL